jgi:gamma-glutamylcyclotransferase (GGCT)/AIG2-like uncharacterized protein YtfP
MKKTLLIFIMLFASNMIFSQAEEVQYGEKISLTEKTEISKILADPESFMDEVVLVEGEVLDVCPKMGCWMELKSEDGEGKIKVKVRDGDIIFPMEAIGHKAVVEGKVYKLELTHEKAIDHFEHIAEEKGVEFDPSTVTGPVTLYQLRGIGAEIEIAD